MSKQAEFAVILKMNPMFADLGADELQRISSLCHTQQLPAGRSSRCSDCTLRQLRLRNAPASCCSSPSSRAPAQYQGWVEADMVFVSPDEIGRWTAYSDGERRRIMDELPQRLEALNARPVPAR